MGPGMMGFGWFGMILMLLIPAGLLILLLLGVVWLVQAAGAPRATDGALTVCPRCHRRAQPDWRICPHCGYHLTDEPDA